MAEQYIKLLAHWKGCEVFQNVGCTGSTDLIIVHPDLEALQIDVKCRSWNSRYNRWFGPNITDVPNHVTLVYVDPFGDIGDWKVSWRNLARGGAAARTPKWACPPGWENFWNNDNRIYTTTSTKQYENQASN